MADGGGERVVPANSVALAGGRVTASPFQFYFDGNDHLRIEGYNLTGGGTLNVFGRFVRDTGEVDVLQFAIPISVFGAPGFRDIPMSRGFLLNLYLDISDIINPHFGSCFAKASIIRGYSGAVTVVARLLQGFVSVGMGLGWPGSPITNPLEGAGIMRVILPATPIPGQPALENVQTGVRWQILGASATLTTSAVAGTRRPFFDLRNAGVEVVYSTHPETVGAGGVLSVAWGPGYPGNVIYAPGFTVACLSVPTLVQGFDVIGFQCFGMQAGDQWSTPRILVLQWTDG